MFVVAFARFCALVIEYKMLKYGVIYLGCWSIFAHATSQATETVNNKSTNSIIESGSTNSLGVANRLSYQAKIQFVPIQLFTSRLIQDQDVQSPKRCEEMRRGFRDFSRKVQKLEGQDSRTEATSNQTVLDACCCNGKPNQSGIVGEDSSGAIAAEMTKLRESIESSMREFRTSLNLVQENIKLLNISLKEIANNLTKPGIEQCTHLPYLHEHNDVPAFMNGTLPTDCWDVFKSGYNVSGVYKIKPASINALPFFVYCQMDVQGGGWTVLQNRYDGRVDFYQDWKHYKSGFGNLNTEFWLGLDHIHELTISKEYELLIELKDFDSQTRFAIYDKFQIGSEAESYPILLLGAYKGNAGDSLVQHVGKKFSTWDMNNDEDTKTNCAKFFTGAWWFYSCYHSHLNGPYLEKNSPNPETTDRGIHWINWRGGNYTLKETRMSIRPRGVAVLTGTK